MLIKGYENSDNKEWENKSSHQIHPYLSFFPWVETLMDNTYSIAYQSA